MKLGKDFGLGFEIGIDRETKAVEESGKKMSEAALNSIDLSEVKKKLQDLDTEGLMNRVYYAFDAQHESVAERLTSELRVREHKNDATEVTAVLSDVDIQNLGKVIGNVTAEKILGALGSGELKVELDQRAIGRLGGF